MEDYKSFQYAAPFPISNPINIYLAKSRIIHSSLFSSLDAYYKTMIGGSYSLMTINETRETLSNLKKYEATCNLSNLSSIVTSRFLNRYKGQELQKVLSYKEINESETKRLKRKQSNRDSARRSRMRKQAEVEKLQIRNYELSRENSILRLETEIFRTSYFEAMSNLAIYFDNLLRSIDKKVSIPIILQMESGLPHLLAINEANSYAIGKLKTL